MLKYHRIFSELLEENTYIVYQDKKCLIIDPGLGFKLFKQIIETEQLTPLAVLCTHAHFDHVAGVSECLNEYDIPFYLSKKSKPVIENFELMSNYWGINAVKPEVTNWISSDTNKLSIDNFDFQIFHNSGHSPGCISFIFDNLIFCGDLIFKGSIGRTDLPGSNPMDMDSSLRSFKKTFSNFNYKILSGHGDESSTIEEFKNNPFLNGI